MRSSRRSLTVDLGKSRSSTSNTTSWSEARIISFSLIYCAIYETCNSIHVRASTISEAKLFLYEGAHWHDYFIIHPAVLAARGTRKYLRWVRNLYDLMLFFLEGTLI